MKRLVFFLFLALTLAPLSAGAAVVQDATASVVYPAVGSIKMAKLVYTATSDVSGNWTLELPIGGALEHIMLKVPATNPATTGYTVRLYSGTAATKKDLLGDAAVNVSTAEDKYLQPAPEGTAVILALAGGGFYLVGSNMGNATTLTIELWIWQ